MAISMRAAIPALAFLLSGVAGAQMPPLNAEGQPAAPAAEPTAAPAPPVVIKPEDILQRLTGEDFTAILTALGWTVTLSADNDGNPYVVGVFTDAETGIAYDFQATLYRCDGANGCYDIVFTRAYDSPKPVTLKMVNDYNAKQIFGCAYLTADGKIGLSLSHTIQGGVTRQTIREIADWWKTVMVSFDAKVTGAK